jgi:DNA-binding NtrC family response regulator
MVHHILRNSVKRKQSLEPVVRKKKILIFSPDPDVAKNLGLLLDDRFEVACESRLNALKERMADIHPALLLVDGYPSPSDIRKLTEVLKAKPKGVLVVMLHVFRNWIPEIETAIHKTADYVLYKPVDVDMIAGLIVDLLHGTRQREQPSSFS